MRQPEHLAIQFSDLGPRDCRWMEGEGFSATYCGQNQQQGSSWCPYHHGICFVPRGPKKEQAAVFEAVAI